MTVQADNPSAEAVRPDHIGRAGSDFVVIGVSMAALLLFVGNGGTLMSQLVRSWLGAGGRVDALLETAVLLNIALILFGWRRYRDLTAEVEERKLAETTARRLAQTDPLTGLCNRRRMPEEITRMIATGRVSGQAVAVLLLDLDNFKKINDLNGHELGDQVLVAVAERLQAEMPPGALLARLGGDEFTCALPFAPSHRERVEELAGAIIARVGRPFQKDGLVLDVTVSIGIIASTDADEADADEEALAGSLLNRADIAMYHAKRAGRNRYAWFAPQMESDLRLRTELEYRIRRGLTRGEFAPYYPQQIDLKSGRLVGFEMLARWNHPDMGAVSPEIFIPIAEDIGVIDVLSEALIRQALLDANGWDASLTLSVNISPVQLRDPWFAQKLLRMLVETGFPPQRLDIEITESCLHENIGAVRGVIASLRNQGIRVSLDDFGTGYSSLHQLRSLPFDQIKIDRSFVLELMEDNANPKLVEAIVSLGVGLDLPITVEGIETQEISETLREMGDLRGQGSLYGRPENAEATRALLASQNLLTGSPLMETAPDAVEDQRRAL